MKRVISACLITATMSTGVAHAQSSAGNNAGHVAEKTSSGESSEVLPGGGSSDGSSKGAVDAVGSSKANDLQTGWYVGKAVVGNTLGRDTMTSSAQRATEGASSLITPGNIAAIGANPGGAAAGAAASGSAVNSLWQTLRVDAGEGKKVGATFDLIAGMGVGALVALLVAAGVHAADRAGLMPRLGFSLRDKGLQTQPRMIAEDAHPSA